MVVSTCCAAMPLGERPTDLCMPRHCWHRQFPIANALSCHPRPFSVCRLQAPGKNRRIPPLPLRPATAEEPVPYLQTPTFSSCTVPVLLYSSWRGNFFHIFKGGCPVAVIHSLFCVCLL